MLLCILLAPGGASTQTEQQSALVLIGTRRDAPMSTVLDETIRSVLNDGLAGRLDYHSEFLDVARFPDREYQEALRDFLRRKYAGRKFDVVVATSDATADFVHEYRDEFCPGAAVVFDASKPRLAPHSTGIVTALDLKRTVDVALTVHPDLRHVFVVTGVSVEDRFYADVARAQFGAYEGRLGFTFSSDMTMPAVLQQVAALPPQTIVYFLSLFEDAHASRFIAFDAFKQVAAAANVPLYHWSDIGMGYGMLGGSVRSSETRARAVASLALRVLKGESPGRIPLQTLDADVTQFDWRQLRRWGINNARLPAGSLVRFREPTLWDRYWFYILATASALVLQTALIGGLLVQGARLRASYARNRDLAGRLINAQELERARIARELHDDVGQRVASLSIGMGTIKRRFAGTGLPVLDELAGLQKETVTLGHDLRTLSHALHPALLGHLGLVEALRARCETVTAESGLAVSFETSELGHVADDVALCFYRIAQEALRNVVNHAHARSATVAVNRQHRDLTIRIADDGRGFDSAAGRSGLGLVSLDERIRMLGGTFAIESGPGKGTLVSATIPCGDPT